MCGIAGGFSFNGVSAPVFRAATDTLTHRGPDAGGYYTDDRQRVFLGHRRLSIIDLSTHANQPMHSGCGRYVMAYNGEVYNFNELRHKLPGFPWKTHSDTEVVLELFAAFGPDCFAWLNGMFALGIYDTQQDQLFLVRDQVGIKPLFYFWDQERLVFASELKAIRSYLDSEGGPKPVLNRSAIPYFLHLGFIPEPMTIYEQVHKFPSGTWARLDGRDKSLSFHTYWELGSRFLHQPVIREAEALKEYRQILFDAVGSQMVSDVPLGTFLSGGIDSSLVTAVASRQSDRKIQTFSIGFEEARYDESEYAAAVARHLGTDHHLFKVSVNEVLDLVPSLQSVYDEPFADTSAFPTMLVSQMARRHVTVTLSGDGGDELFQGYGMYSWANRLNRPLLRAARKPLYMASRLMNDRYRRAGELFNYPSASRLHTHIFSQEQYFFSEPELRKLLPGQRFDFNSINTLASGAGQGSPAERQACWDFNHYLKDDLLVKVDRASMQYSLESRVPLLDMRLVQFAFNLGYGLKVSPEYGAKHLMKKVLYELVPRQIFERPKRGFAIPLKEWLRGPLAYLIDRYLSPGSVARHGVVQPAGVALLLRRFKAGEDYLYNRIWTLIVLHWWLTDNNYE